MYACGGNSSGQLGSGTKLDSDSPLLIKELENIAKIACGQHSSAVNQKGILFIWGTGIFGTYAAPKRIYSITNPIKDIKIGGSFGIALDCDNKLWGWGANSLGELGIRDLEGKATPTIIEIKDKPVLYSCGGSHTIVACEDSSAPLLLTNTLNISSILQEELKLSYPNSPTSPRVEASRQVFYLSAS